MDKLTYEDGETCTENNIFVCTNPGRIVQNININRCFHVWVFISLVEIDKIKFTLVDIPHIPYNMFRNCVHTVFHQESSSYLNKSKLLKLLFRAIEPQQFDKIVWFCKKTKQNKTIINDGLHSWGWNVDKSLTTITAARKSETIILCIMTTVKISII